MALLAVLWGVSVAFELLLHVPGPMWRARHKLALGALFITALLTGALLAWGFNLWTILAVVINLYRQFNHLRILQARMHEHYLKRATLRTSLVLIALQLVVTGFGWAWSEWSGSGRLTWALVAGAQLAAALLLFASTNRSLARTRWPKKTSALSDSELPTLTVAIPARNETEDLQACLESLVLCDYPKLEILVLDDCSQTRRTPEIIRSFAQDGVRFIRGAEPSETWLPKNQAYEHLAKEASGEWILFAGVDARFGRSSLRQVMGMTLNRKKLMLSILPWRAPQAERRFAVIQGLRYAWELVPPRRSFNRPPVLSTCWVIARSALKRSGGFAAVARSIVPEAHFAKFLTKSDTYSFMRANQLLGIESTKSANEQLLTAVRMRYPQLHRRPENVFLLTQAYGFFLILPFVLSLSGLWLSIGVAAQALALFAAGMLVITYMRVSLATRTGGWWFSLIALPFGLVYDIVLLHLSMYRYEFSVVDWQGRNVCIPTMHVYPKLPKI